jgi:hypothetical protein
MVAPYALEIPYRKKEDPDRNDTKSGIISNDVIADVEAHRFAATSMGADEALVSTAVKMLLDLFVVVLA